MEEKFRREDTYLYKFFAKVNELKDMTGEFLASLDSETKAKFGLHKIERPAYDESIVDRFGQLYKKIVFFNEKYTRLSKSQPEIMNFSSIYEKTVKEGEEVEAAIKEIKQVMKTAETGNAVSDENDEERE